MSKEKADESSCAMSSCPLSTPPSPLVIRSANPAYTSTFPPSTPRYTALKQVGVKARDGCTFMIITPDALAAIQPDSLHFVA